MIRKKKIIVKYNGNKTIVIPNPDDIKVAFRGKGKFDFRLKINEPKLKNLVSMLGSMSKKKKKSMV